MGKKMVMRIQDKSTKIPTFEELGINGTGYGLQMHFNFLMELF